MDSHFLLHQRKESKETIYSIKISPSLLQDIYHGQEPVSVIFHSKSKCYLSEKCSNLLNKRNLELGTLFIGERSFDFDVAEEGCKVTFD